MNDYIDHWSKMDTSLSESDSKEKCLAGQACPVLNPGRLQEEERQLQANEGVRSRPQHKQVGAVDLETQRNRTCFQLKS